MQRYVIYVDAAADIDPSFAAGHDLRFVPMSYTIGGEICVCQGLEDAAVLKRFYDGQRRGDLTRTSQASPQQLIDAFTPSFLDGYDILYISLSGGLTNAYDSVRLASLALAERFPDARVCAVDSLAATGGIGLLAEAAVSNREKGMSLEENVSALDKLRHRICHLFMVEDLMYLKHGGRIPAASAVLGTALNIRPILVIDENGGLAVTDKKRGDKLALREIAERYAESRGTESERVYITHADAQDRAVRLADTVRTANPDARIAFSMLSPIIGAHTGPGMVALLFWGDRARIFRRSQ